ncbi:MAG: four-carbon acid sugar kinase family protein [Lachnospiraceae bacterium]|nr:four-carbon acid sugar kinase family protein [Lachnospiraceae bacterium]
MRDKPVSVDILLKYPKPDEAYVDKILSDALSDFDFKIIVLDDDPTGVQTVHDISVYTDWKEDTFEMGLTEKNGMFFILTNSRSFSLEETKLAHTEMAHNAFTASVKTNRKFIIISRSDSTLRGHYPTETKTLADNLEDLLKIKYDGEVIIPFFKEGGRYTIDNIHYVKEGDMLVPAGMTEFAKDKTFGYENSDLGKWCEEKTNGKYKAEDMVYISLNELRKIDVDGIKGKLLSVSDFNKIIVNAIDYFDVKVFAAAFALAMKEGKNFMIRGAAAITKVLGQVADKPLLTKEELIPDKNPNGGIVIVGSHVNKTTKQLEELKNCKYPISFVEFNQHRVIEENGLKDEVQRVVSVVRQKVSAGETVAVYTRRERFDLDIDDKDKQLKVSVEISDAVSSIISLLDVRPKFIIAKGGITSSDIGTKSLKVKRATVMGQIKPGIPVWLTGEESKFPNMPYVIFPGNVGDVSTLREACEILMS